MKITTPASSTPDGPPVPTPHVVLAVDDESAVRELLVMILEYQGNKVLAAESAAQALAMVEAWRGDPIELLITDLAMPGATGDELASKLGEILPELKVIFVSGYSADDPMVTRLDLHNALYLPKPTSPRSLGKAIDSLFDPELTWSHAG